MSLLEQLDRLAGAPVLCTGDLMLDRYLYGTVSRISPEAPIPVLKLKHEATMLGGVGNVARNLVALGADVHLVGVLGDDDNAQAVGRLLAAESGLATAMIVDPDRPTTAKSRFVSGTQQIMRADSETASGLPGEIADAVFEAVEAALTADHVLVLSDYGKGVLKDGMAARLIRLAENKGCRTIVDPKGEDFVLYKGATVVTPNRLELEGATGLPAGTDQEVADAARWLTKQAGLATVVATRGGAGMSVVSANDVCHLRAEAREVFDVSGAGDTVVAVLAAALAGDVPLDCAAALANHAAGVVVAKAGTATATREEIATAIHRRELKDHGAKLLSADEAASQADAWRRAGLRVGFTNGCFDLLHPGHVSLLTQARAHCDRLVVGLNSDASVARLKGPARPVQSETSRAAVLGSLACVDAVVIFGEDTPLSLIERVRPGVLVKGADYALEEVVGGDLVTGWGGEVILAQLVEGHSTTATLSRLQNGAGGGE